MRFRGLAQWNRRGMRYAQISRFFTSAAYNVSGQSPIRRQHRVDFTDYHMYDSVRWIWLVQLANHPTHLHTLLARVFHPAPSRCSGL